MWFLFLLSPPTPSPWSEWKFTWHSFWVYPPPPPHPLPLIWSFPLPLPFPLIRVKVHLAFFPGVPLEDWWPAHTHTHTHTNKQIHYNAVQDTWSWGALHPNCRQWNDQITVFFSPKVCVRMHTHTPHTHTKPRPPQNSTTKQGAHS